jgi:hypothetical protein
MTDESAIETRRREIVTEHLLFHLITHVEAHLPGLLDTLDASVAHLGDPAHDGSKDDEAVRAIARAFLESARKDGVV